MSSPGVSKRLKSDKFLIGIGIAIFCGLVIAFGSVGIGPVAILARATGFSSTGTTTPAGAAAHDQTARIPYSTGAESPASKASPQFSSFGIPSSPAGRSSFSAVTGRADGADGSSNPITAYRNPTGVGSHGFVGLNPAASLTEVHSIRPADAAAGAQTPADASAANSPVPGRRVNLTDIDQLADKVDLSAGALQNMDRAQWANELPLAEQLLQGMCDCEQRNWLKRFVVTANDALANSADYYTSVHILAGLRREDAPQ